MVNFLLAAEQGLVADMKVGEEDKGVKSISSVEPCNNGIRCIK
jgi:hypothetical protein